MYHNKHITKRKPRKINKPILLLVLLGLVVTAIIGTTIAYLITNTSGIENIFKPSKVSSAVVETINGLIKSNVMIQNKGNTEAYIRVAIVVTWKNEAGNVHSTQPALGLDKDYTMLLDLDHGWSLGRDGFYYWALPVESGESTGVLLVSCTPVAGKAPDGYYLSVEIIGSAIQSTPTTAVIESWSVAIDENGNMTKPVEP